MALAGCLFTRRFEGEGMGRRHTPVSVMPVIIGQLAQESLPTASFKGFAAAAIGEQPGKGGTKIGVQGT